MGLLLALAPSSRADAQGGRLLVPDSLRTGVRFGLLAGLSRGTLDGAGFDGPRTGFTVGGALHVPLRGRLSFQPELHYTQRGGSGTPPGTVAITTALDYLELPLLARLDLGARTAALRPFVLGGATIGYRIRCEVVTPAPLGSGAVDTGCDNATLPLTSTFPLTGETRALDHGLVLGGGAEFTLGGQRMTLGARYTLGTADVAARGDRVVRTRAVQLLLGVRF